MAKVIIVPQHDLVEAFRVTARSASAIAMAAMPRDVLAERKFALGGATKRERLDSAHRGWQATKELLLAQLRSHAGVSVRDLPASPQAVVEAPVSVWRDLFAPGGILASDPSVLVRPNELFYAI